MKIFIQMQYQHMQNKYWTVRSGCVGLKRADAFLTEEQNHIDYD